MKRILALALASAMVLSLAACGKKDEPAPEASGSSSSSQSTPDASQPEADKSEEPAPEADKSEEPAAELKLNNTDFSLFKAGATFQLKVAGAEKDAKILWTSSDEKIAAVDEKGVVTCVAAGAATITAEVDGQKLTAKVYCKVEDAAEAVKPEEKPAEKPAASADLTAFYATLEQMMLDTMGEENAPSMMPMDSAMLDSYYPGLTALGLKQCVVAGPMISAVVAEFALAEAKDAAQAAQAAKIFQARIDAQVNGGGWYPATIEGWENNSRIVTNGNYVMMLAIENNQPYVDAFNALFK